MHTKQIIWFGKSATLACDGICVKAFGINGRAKKEFDSADPDDYAFLADDELGDAPSDPGTYEGGCAKPGGPHEMNKWCSRECERSKVFDSAEHGVLPDFSRRVFNQSWKHAA